MKNFRDMLPRFELIAQRHDVSNFDCRYTLINAFLKTKALNETLNDMSRTFVLIDASVVPEYPVVGYFTLRADSFYDNALSSGNTTVPAIEISFLARHKDLTGQGIGDFLLTQALAYVVEVSKWVGVAGVHLAFTQEGKPLYDRFGFGAHPYGAYNLFLPIANARILVAASE